MAYDQTGLCNIALSRVGAKSLISDINEKTVPAVRLCIVWDSTFQEVLSERDWRFAKTRSELALSTFTPLYAYQYAWALPADFLRFVRPHRKAPNQWGYYWGSGMEGSGWYSRQDPPLYPMGFPYIVETLPDDGKKYVLLDYDGGEGVVMINYIRLITDYSQLTAGFVNCFCSRLAAEVAIPLTEDKEKKSELMKEYKAALNSAEAQNECYDFSENESGNRNWERAGRW